MFIQMRGAKQILVANETLLPIIYQAEDQFRLGYGNSNNRHEGDDELGDK